MYKFIIKTPEQGQWRRFCAFHVSFEHISKSFSSVSFVRFEQVNVTLVFNQRFTRIGATPELLEFGGYY